MHLVKLWEIYGSVANAWVLGEGKWVLIPHKSLSPVEFTEVGYDGRDGNRVIYRIYNTVPMEE